MPETTRHSAFICILPQTVIVGGYTVFTLCVRARARVCVCVRASVRNVLFP